jgi:ubiquinone/menaquinone biosynthesis C-methylase UbiE
MSQVLTPQEWEKIESAEHDRVYDGSHPFFFTSEKIDPQAVITWEDYCYKPNRRADRGHRTKRLFQVMGVPDLKGKRILDIGCGNGQYAVLFAMLGATVEAFDLSPVGVERGRRFAAANGVADRCHFSVGNASAMPYADGSFDILVMHEVLHHAVKYPMVAEECARVLDENGFLVCAESLRGNFALDIARKITMRGEEAKGDVILELSHLQDFSRSFSSYSVELMSLLFMAKRVVERYVDRAPVRALLKTLKVTDDVLLRVFPGLKKYCGECVVIYQK